MSCKERMIWRLSCTAPVLGCLRCCPFLDFFLGPIGADACKALATTVRATHITWAYVRGKCEKTPCDGLCDSCEWHAAMHMADRWRQTLRWKALRIKPLRSLRHTRRFDRAHVPKNECSTPLQVRRNVRVCNVRACLGTGRPHTGDLDASSRSRGPNHIPARFHGPGPYFLDMQNAVRIARMTPTWRLPNGDGKPGTEKVPKRIHGEGGSQKVQESRSAWLGR
jgi:hypothetical protein